MRLRTVGKLILAVVGCVLLVSVGGEGAVAAPVTLVLFYLASRDASRPERLGWTLLAAATAAEAAWVVVYLLVGERLPYVVTAPIVAAIACVLVFAPFGTRRPAPVRAHRA